MVRYKEKCQEWIALTRKYTDLEKGHTGHRKVKCELNQGVVMINLYVQFTLILLKVADR